MEKKIVWHTKILSTENSENETEKRHEVGFYSIEVQLICAIGRQGKKGTQNI